MRKLGLKPDTPDIRDKMYTARGVIKAKVVLPDSATLEGYFLDVRDQGDIGSCSAFAVTSVVDALYRLKFSEAGLRHVSVPPAAPLFTYYVTRELENNVGRDDGATMRGAIKSVNTYGASYEELWPYDVNHVHTKPTDQAYEVALKRQAVKYERVRQNEYDLCYCIVRNFAVVFGASIYPSFYTAPDGVIPIPQRSERLDGGHALVIVGYDAKARYFVVRNSWGKDWGQDGYCLMPFDYILDSNLACDFWTINLMEDDEN